MRYIGCPRVEAMPKPVVESDMERCQVCDMAIWLAKSTPKHRDEYPNVKLMCMPCLVEAVKVADNVTFEPVSREQIEDLTRQRPQ